MGKGPAGARHPVSPAAYKQTFLLVPYPVYTSRKGKRRVPPLDGPYMGRHSSRAHWCVF